MDIRLLVAGRDGRERGGNLGRVGYFLAPPIIPTTNRNCCKKSTMPILQHGVPQKLSRNSLARISKISHSTRHLFTQSTPAKRTPIRTGLYTTAFVLSAGVFAVYYLDARSALHRYILTPILRNVFDVETAHKIAVKTLKSGLAPRDPVGDDERLKSQVNSTPIFLPFPRTHISL